MRLRGHPSLSFPPRDVMTVEVGEHMDGRTRFDLEIACMTLYGVDTPLPLHITEKILHSDSTAVRDFLDIFNHRILSLLYRIWGRYRLHVGCTQWGEDDLTRQINDLIDLPEIPMALRYAGIFFQRPRSATGLEHLLRAYFPDVPVAVEQCLPREITISPRQQCQVGMSGCSLGQDLILGERIVEVNGSFRVCVGPLSREHRGDFLPDSDQVQRIHALVDAWCQEPLDWELLVLRASEDIQSACLSGDNPRTRLGINSWLGQPPDASTATTLRPCDL